MKITVKMNQQKLHDIEKAVRDSAVDTMEALYTDLVSSQTMPFDTGNMQNNQTFTESTENGAVLITGAPQARRLYYHPEYNFQTAKNKNAGAYWLEPYLTGNKKDFVKTSFAEALERRGHELFITS